ncbi:hypothetical protein DdX_02406 [Ditylenchus destructor]|uniref:Uncharacterized protein n=1 Tax=Ditylenchus destructor TaxID=166010 RepID=A0AAD4R925_9BILA|nr:hypothetical protein DdX_02406 [Ditylenchus destructor]
MKLVDREFVALFGKQIIDALVPFIKRILAKMATPAFTSSHPADHDIMDAIFTKVQLADVKFTNPEYRPTSAPLRRSLRRQDVATVSDIVNNDDHIETTKSEGNSPRVCEDTNVNNEEDTENKESGELHKKTENHEEETINGENRPANGHHGLIVAAETVAENMTEHIEQNGLEEYEDEIQAPILHDENDIHHSDGEYYNRPSDMIHFENGIMDSERSSIGHSSHSSESLSPTLPKKNTDHDRLLQELKHHQIQQQIQLADQATSDSEPETLDSATAARAAEIGLEHSDDDKTPQNSEDDEDTYYEESEVGDPDVQPVKSIHYHFGMDVECFVLLKLSFRFERVHQMSSQDADDGEYDVPENTDEVFEAEPYQETPRPRPAPLHVNNVDENSTNGMHPESSPMSPPYGHYDLRSPSEKHREIEVRTPLHESIGRSYTSFEPDKQELIRKEMGHVTVNSIRHLLGRFQQLSQDAEIDQNIVVDPDLEHDRRHYIESSHHHNNPTPSPLGDSLSPLQNKIQFKLPPSNAGRNGESLFERRDPIVKTPHPVALARKTSQPVQLFPESEVVLEEQKPVSELLSKFGAKVKPKSAKLSNLTSPTAAPIYGNVVLRKVHPGNLVSPSSPVKDYGLNNSRANGGVNVIVNGNIPKLASANMSPTPPSYYTFWGKPSDAKNNRLSSDREPPIGSVAAIRKSLSSVPTSPIHANSPTIPEPVEVEHFSPRGQYQSPKNVRQFYKVYGRKSPNGAPARPQ